MRVATRGIPMVHLPEKDPRGSGYGFVGVWVWVGPQIPMGLPVPLPIQHFICCPPVHVVVEGDFEWGRDTTLDLQMLEVLDALSQCLNL
jgi:hypothetical protein